VNDDSRVTLARLRAKAGIADEEDLMHLVAERIGPDEFLLRGEVLSGAELEAKMREEYEDNEYEIDAVYRRVEREIGREVDTAARKLLAARGIYDADAATYLQACREAGASRGTTAMNGCCVCPSRGCSSASSSYGCSGRRRVFVAGMTRAAVGC
jgi:hypothetical protein